MIIFLVVLFILWSLIGGIRLLNYIDYISNDMKKLFRFYIIGGPLCWFVGVCHLLYCLMESIAPMN